MVDCRLPDGSRVNAIIPPLSLIGPVLSIRRFGTRHLGQRSHCLPRAAYRLLPDPAAAVPACV